MPGMRTSERFVEDACNSGYSPQPYMLYTVKVRQVHSVTGWKNIRKRIPVAGGENNQKGVLPPMKNRAHSVQPIQNSSNQSWATLRSCTPPVHRNQGSMQNFRSRQNYRRIGSERDDCIARVQNLDNFDPVEKTRSAKDRRVAFLEIAAKNMKAALIAQTAANSVDGAIVRAEYEIEQAVRRVKASRENAAKTAREAAAAAWKKYDSVMEKIAEEIQRLAKEKAKKAAFDAALQAHRAAQAARGIPHLVAPVLKYIEAQKAILLMEEIQRRVVTLMHVDISGIDCNLISVNLIKNEVKLLEQVQFEPGTSTIKSDSMPLLDQLVVARKCITKTCREFEVDDMLWRVEGHTAKSKKSADGGIATSMARAKAVCGYLRLRGVDVNFLRAEGCGSFRPPSDPSTDARRVEIHVVKPDEPPKE